MADLLENTAAILWIVLGIMFFFKLRAWNKKFELLYNELKEQIGGLNDD